MTQDIMKLHDAAVQAAVNAAVRNLGDRDLPTRAALQSAVEAQAAEIEQLRVQLAGCGVAAMQNTETSKAQRVEKGSYGYSESYADVCRAVDREIELRNERDALAAENKELTLTIDVQAGSIEAVQEANNRLAAKLQALQEQDCQFATARSCNCNQCAQGANNMTTEQITIPRKTFDAMREALNLLEEVPHCFTREDDLPNNLIPRIDAALAAANALDHIADANKMVPAVPADHLTPEGAKAVAEHLSGIGEMVQPQVQGMADAIVKELEPLLKLKNQSWALARKRVDEILSAANPNPTGPELFTPLARKKLEALQSQGFVINGYAIRKGEDQGFVTSFGLVGWHSTDTAPAIKESLTAPAWERCQWWQCGLAKRCVNQGKCGTPEQSGKEVAK